jgi:hypothetical protein
MQDDWGLFEMVLSWRNRGEISMKRLICKNSEAGLRLSNGWFPLGSHPDHQL